MNAHAVVMRYARAPLALRSPYLPSAQSTQRRTLAPSATRYRGYLRVLAAMPTRHSSGGALLKAVRLCFTSPSFNVVSNAWSAIRELIACMPVEPRIAGRLAAAGVIGAMAALATINNERDQPRSIGVIPGNETVVYRQAAAQGIPLEDEGEPVAEDSENGAPASYPRIVQTIRFVASSPSAVLKSAKAVATKVGAFVAFPGATAPQTVADAGDWPAVRKNPGAPNMDEVDKYLWEVYQRQPTKRDHSGDFTWKDPAAAKRMGLSVPEYAISGMDPDFREELYHAGHAMDAAGIQWSILSGFRDDYRQRLASGFKARVGNSLHGGSRATGGWGHGRAVDLTSADGDASVVWHWIDAHGAKFGLYRPIPGPDPAHIQSRGDWHKVAVALRESRVRMAGSPPAEPEAAKKVAKAGL
ncbi:MAG TPA: hypothetical protein VH678_31080 [Xanthobacteraceae bacterium]